MRISPGTIVCISPHPDDAALSCGGLLAMRRAQDWPAQVITIFAGPAPPAEQLTPFARSLHQSWGSLPDPLGHRRQEDRCALEVLGCSGAWWDYRDAIYRHPAYNSRERIFGRPAEETALEEELDDRLAALPGDLLLFPLAIGQHVDHQLVFRVGWKLGQAGRRVAFYEDLPYAAWQSGLHRGEEGDRDRGPKARLEELSQPLYPQTVAIGAFWPTKVKAISCYASQFAELTHDGVPLLEALERYARSFPGGYAERLWWPEEGKWI